MKYRSIRCVLLCLLLCAGSILAGEASYSPRCQQYHPDRLPFFGDTHVHTRYSLDANTQGTRTSPAEAYRFAKGESIGIQPWSRDGKPLRNLQLQRPLDFAVVTDHAEMIGEVSICNTPGADGYDHWQCKLYRSWPRTAFFIVNTMTARGKRLSMCGENGEDCSVLAAAIPWQEMQEAARLANDETADCNFTAFVGYEWTGASKKNISNLHRNVIFANENVPDLPISFFEADTAEKLWHDLDEQCVNAGKGCDVVVIPHNSNLSDAQMFLHTKDDGSPIDAAYAARVQRLETLVEVMQHKGSSECFFGPGATEDELCAFEQLPYDKFSGKFTSWLQKDPEADDGFLRNVLTEGMQEQQRIGVNPFKWGFIASTDTHLGTPGAVDENNFPGHGGAGEPASEDVPRGLPDDLEFNPGGLAVLWAEENSRESLFAAMKRREAYGTSGPRMTVRMFGGWDYPMDLCQQEGFVQQGYAQGVPMGSDLPALPAAEASPRFAVSALKDSGTATSPGTDLQRIQIIKGWLDSQGKAQQAVFDVAGDPQNGASVDLNTCQTHGNGAASLCRVWQDPAFDSSQHAWYYARVVENPTCRWSQQVCAANKVDCSKPGSIAPGLEACCSDQHRPVIQERAWTSPIWYSPR